jgi:hypothetical protein
MLTLSLQLLTVCLILLPVNCLSSVYGQSEEFSNYENPKFGFKMQYPKSWIVSDLSNASVHHSIFGAMTLFNSSDNSVVVGTFIQPTNQTFEQFNSERMHNMTSLNESMNKLSKKMGLPGIYTSVKIDKATISGLDAWKMTMSGSNDTSYDMWTVKNNYVYGINFGSDNLNILVYGPIFQKMVNSIVIK